ncbi:MAG: hypothetical protein GX793_00450 [Bacteroidales bacterium]|jgi:hypothetical protein|nr:hypothetical protein [Bacteroidales bacterium]MCK9498604.1 hypothetical protein [Bacteroidales bacterium]MDY0315775.1 hypothetical protein [Bacteroidales bacterium]NLB85511.1 hypothetical protein [Bacteroidales bacterium]
MKIKDVFEIEKANVDSINLFKEGLFWRAYEYSAWRFVKYIKEYKLLNKYVKSINSHIVYIGFPDSFLDSIINLIKLKDKSFTKFEKHINIKAFSEEKGFEIWKTKLIESGYEKISNNDNYVLENPEIVYSVNNSGISGNQNPYVYIDNKSIVRDAIIQKIIDFPLENTTGIEALNFLHRIKIELYGTI